MKFRNTKTKKTYKKARPQKPQKFPRNYRIIPEQFKREEVLFIIGIFIIFAAILIISSDLYFNIKEQKRTTDEKIRIINEISFWQSIARERPNYRDAYYNLALLNYELRDFENARNNLEKAFSFDPNFEKGRELEKLLNSF